MGTDGGLPGARLRSLRGSGALSRTPQRRRLCGSASRRGRSAPRGAIDDRGHRRRTCRRDARRPARRRATSTRRGRSRDRRTGAGARRAPACPRPDLRAQAGVNSPRTTAPLRLYLTARFTAATALMMLRAAIAWEVFAISKSAFHLGMIGIVQFLPALGLSLVGGAIADSRDRRRVMIIAELVPLACG